MAATLVILHIQTSTALTLDESLTLIVSKLLMTLIDFALLCVTFYPLSTHKCLWTKLNDMLYAWFLILEF